MKRRAFSEWGAVAAGVVVVAATATGAVSAGRGMRIQQCTGGSPCGAIKVKCKPTEDACCCRTGAGLYGCACHTADFCQRPPSGTTCFD